MMWDRCDEMDLFICSHVLFLWHCSSNESFGKEEEVRFPGGLAGLCGWAYGWKCFQLFVG